MVLTAMLTWETRVLLVSRFRTKAQRGSPRHLATRRMIINGERKNGRTEGRLKTTSSALIQRCRPFLRRFKFPFYMEYRRVPAASSLPVLFFAPHAICKFHKLFSLRPGSCMVHSVHI